MTNVACFIYIICESFMNLEFECFVGPIRKSKLQDGDEGVGEEDEDDGTSEFDKEFPGKDSTPRHHQQKQQHHRETDKYLHKHYHSYPPEEDEEQMDINEIARRPQRRRPDQIWNTYRDTLMFSEWLVEVRMSY